ncbi:hypothetical protein [Leptospira interrogans]|uniref:hypothetical protein n=1 Tax=Leptospira interrogans TaxID=173 RepID=UPI000371C98D|nr:hypothetical protein [Leptospira interrogans]MBO8030980.1 hypothetical protein [Leptospira interrogans serovar Copenhageni]
MNSNLRGSSHILQMNSNLRGSSHILQMNLNLRGSSHIFKSWAFDKENQISAQNRRSTIVFT